MASDQEMPAATLRPPLMATHVARMLMSDPLETRTRSTCLYSVAPDHGNVSRRHPELQEGEKNLCAWVMRRHRANTQDLRSDPREEAGVGGPDQAPSC